MAGQTTPELVITRVFNAPRARVWEAWTKPEQIEQWWGPKGFTSPKIQIDLREGGKYLNGMQSPEFNNGEAIWGTGVYKEIVPMERLVATDSFADENGNPVPGSHYGMGDMPAELLLTVTFADSEDGKTKMTLRHTGMPASQSEDANTGWNESFDKLENFLK